MSTAISWIGELDAHSMVEDASGLWEYVVVFVLAMVPAIEPFIVIPLAIGLGLNPVFTAIAAFAGSVAAMGIIILGQQRVAAWWSKRTSDSSESNSGRYGRIRRLWQRYGVVGLAFGGPPLAGIHLTALFAAMTSRDVRFTSIWLAIGIGCWTVVLTFGSLVGFAFLGLR